MRLRPLFGQRLILSTLLGNHPKLRALFEACHALQEVYFPFTRLLVVFWACAPAILSPSYVYTILPKLAVQPITLISCGATPDIPVAPPYIYKCVSVKTCALPSGNWPGGFPTTIADRRPRSRLFMDLWNYRVKLYMTKEAPSRRSSRRWERT